MMYLRSALFVKGFGSSAVFGTVAGATADRRCVKVFSCWILLAGVGQQKLCSRQACKQANVLGWLLLPHLMSSMLGSHI